MRSIAQIAGILVLALFALAMSESRAQTVISIQPLNPVDPLRNPQLGLGACRLLGYGPNCDPNSGGATLVPPVLTPVGSALSSADVVTFLAVPRTSQYLLADTTTSEAVVVPDGIALHVNATWAAKSLTVSANGELRGTGAINAPTVVNGVTKPYQSPGTLTFTAPLTFNPGSVLALETDGTGSGNGGGNYSRVVVRGATATLTGGVMAPLLRGLTHSGLGDGAPPTNTYTPPLGQRFAGVVAADGGLSGSFDGLAQPEGRAAGTRFDTLYGPRAIDLVVTPQAYGNLSAAGLAQSASQAALGAALDTVRPAAGIRTAGAAQTVFDTLYALPAGSLSSALDQLSPMIYADALMAGRMAWGAMEGTVTRRMAATRAAGSQDGVVWVDALGVYGAVRSGAGSPGATSGLGGVAVGYDRPLDAAWRVGAAISAAGGRVWSQTGSRAGLDAGQVTLYAQWQQAAWFVEAQLGTLYQQANTTRPMPSFGATAQGSAQGFGAGGMVRAGYRVDLGNWHLEPSLGFGGLALTTAGQTETGGGPLSLRTQGQNLGSARSVLAVSARRAFTIGQETEMTLRADLGWAHEFAATRATVAASFVGLPGTAFRQSSAPIGRDTALVGLAADFRLPSIPVPLFLAYGGGFANAATTQSVTAGMRMAW